MPQQNKDKEILEAFDEEFVEMHFCIAPILYDMKFDDIDKIKSFISKALQQVREEERREYKKGLIGNVALFGAVLMSIGITGKEKKELKELMWESLQQDTKMGRDFGYENNADECN